jgi:hypothetical protein
MRRVRSVISLVVVAGAALLMGGCPGETQVHRARAPRGPRLRLVETVERTPAKMLMEIDPRRHPEGPATLHTFTFTLEEKVGAPVDGRAPVLVRFHEVVGSSGEPDLSNQYALALDELKLNFWRDTRGAASELKIEGLRAPLDTTTAKAIAFTLLGIGHGARMPERAVSPLDDWTIEADTELVGLTAHERYFYTLVAENGPVLQIREKGHVEGIATLAGARRKLDGDTFSLESIDIDRGVVAGGEYEWTSMVQEEPAGMNEPEGLGRLRLRFERGTAVDAKRR